MRKEINKKGREGGRTRDEQGEGKKEGESCARKRTRSKEEA